MRFGCGEEIGPRQPKSDFVARLHKLAMELDQSFVPDTFLHNGDIRDLGLMIMRITVE